MDKVSPIYRSQLTRNLRAFLKAKGEEFDPARTPEYLTQGANLLKKTFGVHLAAYICNQTDIKRFNKWVKGQDLPEIFEAGGLLNAIEITEILLGKLNASQAKQWMLTPKEYILYELPMDVIRSDAELVRRAALMIYT